MVRAIFGLLAPDRDTHCPRELTKRKVLVNRMSHHAVLNQSAIDAPPSPRCERKMRAACLPGRGKRAGCAGAATRRKRPGRPGTSSGPLARLTVPRISSPAPTFVAGLVLRARARPGPAYRAAARPSDRLGREEIGSPERIAPAGRACQACSQPTGLLSAAGFRGAASDRRDARDPARGPP